MSGASLQTAGILLITVPAVQYGGLTLLHFMRRRTPGYIENPMRRALFTAGHAHAGVLVILALVALLYVDQTSFSGTVKELLRWAFVLPPILMPAGFFLSVASPRVTRPGPLINLAYLGAAALAAGVLTLGAGLLSA